MRNNTKVQAILSINPSFNMDFVNERIYNKPFYMDNIMTEMKIDSEPREIDASRTFKKKNIKS